MRVESVVQETSFARDRGLGLPMTTRTDMLVPLFSDDESCASWIERAGETLGVGSALLDLDRDAPERLKSLAMLGRPSPSHLAELDAYRDGGQLAQLSRAPRTDRLFCAVCALKRLLEGKTYVREKRWEVAWATSCARDATPLLEEPPGRIEDIIRTQQFAPLDKEILAASSRTEPPWFTLNYLDWSLLWRRVAALETSWHRGERLDDLQVLSDIAAVLCADFDLTPDRSAIALLCRLPSIPSGYQLPEPVSGRDCALSSALSVHVRRTAMTVAYALFEIALMKSRLPRVFPQTSVLASVFLRVWPQLLSVAHPAMWRWLVNASRQWPNRHAFAVMMALERICPQARTRLESLVSEPLFARHLGRLNRRRTIEWSLASTDRRVDGCENSVLWDDQ